MKKYLVNLKIKQLNFFMYKFWVQRTFHPQYFFVKKRTCKKFFFSKFQKFIFSIQIERFNKIVNFPKKQKLKLKNISKFLKKKRNVRKIKKLKFKFFYKKALVHPFDKIGHKHLKLLT
jgi:hypothetical protein